MKKILLAISIISVLAACTSKNPVGKNEFSANLIKDGSISISRPLPPVTELKLENVLSFMPLQIEKSWIQISIDKKELNLMKGSKLVSSWDLENSAELNKGTFRVVLKEKNAPWYATDEYYINRGLSIPAQNYQERYLKAALGENSIFLDNGLTIYSSDIADPSIKGIRVNKEAAESLFSAAQAGDLLIIG